MTAAASSREDGTRFQGRERFTNWTQTVRFTMNNRFHGGLVLSPSRPNRSVDPSTAPGRRRRQPERCLIGQRTVGQAVAEGLLGGGRRTSRRVNINTSPVAVRL